MKTVEIPGSIREAAKETMAIRIKICGITRLEDALAAVEAGADALGFMFYQASPRLLDWESARRIVEALPPMVCKVGVFVDAPVSEIRQAAEASGIDTLQLHGDEPPGFASELGLKCIKAFRVRDAGTLDRLAEYRNEAWLLDAYAPGQHGGTGATFNWQLANEARRFGDRPIILAGGLTPANVAEAIRSVRPFAVDVSSGVENGPGKKDAEKIRAFVSAARGA